MNKMQFSTLLLIALASQQAFSLQQKQLTRVLAACKCTETELYAKVPSARTSNDEAGIIEAYKAATGGATPTPAPRSAPTPPAPQPAFTKVDPVTNPKSGAPAPKVQPAASNSPADLQTEINALRNAVDTLKAERDAAASNLDGERRSHAITKTQHEQTKSELDIALKAAKVADAIKKGDPDNSVIARVAQDFIDDFLNRPGNALAAKNDPKVAAFKSLLTSAGVGQQSHTLGRLGSSKKGHKNQNRYAN